MDAIPTGPAWAAILAVSIGCATSGLLCDLTEAFPSVSKALNFYNPTGDLSGKSTLTIALWLVIWAILHAKWKNLMIESPRIMTAVSVVLVLLAILAVFPPFFELFAAG